MFRMKDKLNQTIVGADYLNPVDEVVTNVWMDKGTMRGRVTLNGKKHKVHSVGNGIWMLSSGQNMTAVYPEADVRNRCKVA